MKSILNIWVGIKKTKLFYVCNIFLPLLIGAFVYFLFVPTAHISVWLYEFLGKKINLNYVNLSGTIVTCFLADFLWAYALFFLVHIIYTQKKNDTWITLFICFGFEILIEFLQLTPIFDGTFDLFDIAVEILANLLALGIYLIYCNSREMLGKCNDFNN